jgi:hypothetical protein
VAADAGWLYGLDAEHDPRRASALAWRARGVERALHLRLDALDRAGPSTPHSRAIFPVLGLPSCLPASLARLKASVDTLADQSLVDVAKEIQQ